MYSLHLYAFILPVNPIGWLSYSRTNYLFECGECVCVYLSEGAISEKCRCKIKSWTAATWLQKATKPLQKKRIFLWVGFWAFKSENAHICLHKFYASFIVRNGSIHGNGSCEAFLLRVGFFSLSLFRLLASATNRILYQRWKCFLVETDWTTDRDAVTLVCWKRSIEMSVVMMIVAGCMLPCRRCKNYANVCLVRPKWNFSVNGGSSANVTMGNHANVWNSHANGRIELEWRLKIRQICILHLWWNGFQSLKKEPFNN